MSTRGVKGSAVARGGTDGSDFSHRQVLAPRYEAMAAYRAQLVQLFSYLPFFLLTAALLAVTHFHVLKSTAAVTGALAPFWLNIGGLILAGAVSLQSIRLQSKLPWMVLSALFSALVLYLGVLHLLAAVSASAGAVWLWLSAATHALIVLLNALAIYAGFMITQLQGSKK